GFGTVADGEWFAAKLRDPAVMAELAPDHSSEWQGLGVSILHKLVLGRRGEGRLRAAPALKVVDLLKRVRDGGAATRRQVDGRGRRSEPRAAGRGGRRTPRSPAEGAGPGGYTSPTRSRAGPPDPAPHPPRRARRRAGRLVRRVRRLPGLRPRRP